MSSNHPDRHIAIVGAGFSGSLLAVHLLARADSATHVTLIERHPPFGTGLAYRTRQSSHVLNVPAARMSAFEDRPDDFVNWLAVQPEASHSIVARDTLAQAFVPRQRYGQYLQSLLDRHASDTLAGLTMRRGEVRSVARTPDGLDLKVDDEPEAINCDRVVLALGHFPPDADRPPHYFGNPWSPAALRNLPADATVVLIGSGLTMVDMVSTLLDRQHRGSIVAVSRHGLLPKPHQPGAPPQLPSLPEFPDHRLRTLMADLRRHCRSLENGHWRTFIDTFRHEVPDIWQAFSHEERVQFLRHVRPWWDIHRHRMAPQIHERIQAARDSGQLKILAGRVEAVEPHEQAVNVVIRPRGKQQRIQVDAVRVLNCAGPRAYGSVQDALLKSMIDVGLCRADPLGLGLDVSENCEVLAHDGQAQPDLRAVGPVTRGRFWEITAVPEIRRQCEAVARQLLL